MSTAAGANALLEQSGLPRFDLFQAGQVKGGMEETLHRFEKEFAVLEGELASAAENGATYEAVVDRVEKVEAPVSFAWGLVSHLTSVRDSEELRLAHQEMQPKVVKAMQALSQSTAVFRALKAIDPASLDPVQARVVAKSVRGMELAGIGLEGAARESFNALKLRQAELATKFSNNVLDSTKAFRLTLSDPAQVAGVPASGLALMAHNALADSPNATAEQGPWVVTLDAPCFMAFMQHGEDRELREKIYRAYVSRASEGEADNEPLIREIVRIRQEASAMLGFGSHAELSLSTKMAESPVKVLELLEFMRVRSRPFAEAEMAELERFATEKGLVGGLKHWDVAYWAERVKQERYGFSEEDLRPYFSLEAALKGLFDLVERLFSVRIVAADGETSVWHPDVRYFRVLDAASGDQIASFFLDPYSRPGEKRSGAWMGVCQGRSRVLDRKPVAYLVCNGSPPTDGKPSLMSFDQVLTLFHEAGHGLQHMLTSVEHADAAGINGVEWDAVELPSQWMEEWLYDRGTLLTFARHHETGAPLPGDLFDKLSASRHYNAGMFMLRQLNFAALDMALHSADYDPQTTSPVDVQVGLSDKFALRAPLPEDRFICSFQHIFAGGYSAGYYSYLFSRIMSSDAFAAFEEVGLQNDSAIRELGARFRETVLGLGGGTHPAEVFRRFRGRDPSPEALLRHSGLDTEGGARARL